MKRFQTLTVIGFFVLITAWIIYIVGATVYMQKKPQKKLQPVVVLSLDSSMYYYGGYYQYDMRYLDRRGDTCEYMLGTRATIDSLIAGTIDPTKPW